MPDPPDEPFRKWQRDPSSAVEAARQSWANTTDRTARTAPARAAQHQRFLDEVDPKRVLTEDERNQRADQAKREWYRALARMSARRRRLRSKPASGGEHHVA